MVFHLSYIKSRRVCRLLTIFLKIYKQFSVATNFSSYILSIFLWCVSVFVSFVYSYSCMSLKTISRLKLGKKLFFFVKELSGNIKINSEWSQTSLQLLSQYCNVLTLRSAIRIRSVHMDRMDHMNAIFFAKFLSIHQMPVGYTCVSCPVCLDGLLFVFL